MCCVCSFSVCFWGTFFSGWRGARLSESFLVVLNIRCGIQLSCRFVAWRAAGHVRERIGGREKLIIYKIKNEELLSGYSLTVTHTEPKYAQTKLKKANSIFFFVS